MNDLSTVRMGEGGLVTCSDPSHLNHRVHAAPAHANHPTIIHSSHLITHGLLAHNISSPCPVLLRLFKGGQPPRTT